MNQKELKEKLRYIPANKYIYQRHDGIIYKYIDTGDYYISCKTGINCASGSCLLGKVEDNLVELVEVGDIVEIFDVLNEDVIYIWNEEMLKALKEDIKNGIGIRRILTHEQFEANCYKVEEE